MPPLTWLVWAVLTGIAGLAVFLSARAALLGTRKALALAALAGAAAISGLALLRAQPSSRQLTIEITSPATASRIEGHQVWISGTVKPPDARVAVAVRPDGSDLWWLQETVRPQADGHWSVAAYLGEPEVGRGATLARLAEQGCRHTTPEAGHARDGQPQAKPGGTSPRYVLRRVAVGDGMATRRYRTCPQPRYN